MSTIQRKSMCDCDSMYCGPRAKHTISMKPAAGRLSQGDAKCLLHVTQAISVTVIVFAISVGVMLQCGRCQQQDGLPCFLLVEASGNQMLLIDEQGGGPDSGWAFCPISAIQTSALGHLVPDTIGILLLLPCFDVLHISKDRHKEVGAL